MGASRITQRLMVDRVLRNLNRQSREILKLQEQLATGQRVNRPSDDPLAVRRAVNAQAQAGRRAAHRNRRPSLRCFIGRLGRRVRHCHDRADEPAGARCGYR